ncbi:tRNA:m(4)X modification enzyme TRM13-like protein isoform X1 [Cucumis melo var. makuwa]|uniref:tRNA:m(4)X modification enzyme TRM13 n=1 Tax=Cucumis melo var. makuwa TaxID=1194695 RepID=A0A5A7UYK4_CUCMM|nr:tRNA:m(4)X modification enzyme TRM13-like protein isoform X1 [Cucumis melo var. makuwa]
MASRCQFWLPKKNRFCAVAPINDSKFCGNHSSRADGDMVPCPVDPSHSVLRENLQGHVKRCPLLKQTQSLAGQPFYQKGINAGEEDLMSANGPDSGLSDSISSEMKRNIVYGMSGDQFHRLLGKIRALHDLICKDIQDSYQIKEACNMWIKGEIDSRKIPFQEKHVLQQASILGNLDEFGVLRNYDGGQQREGNRSYGNDANVVPAVVEFGAGRGYLTQMLADCYGIKRVFLVERKSYKLKADRSLRQKESLILERLRIDIEDLNLNAVESLRHNPYLAIGKHLCGPATDLALRCCLTKQPNQADTEQCRDKSKLRGLAIATCCHHLCQWKHYTNKRYLLELGITKEEFLAITWFTSWAVDANHSEDISDVTDSKTFLQSSENESDGMIGCTVDEIVKSMNPVERAVLGFMCKEIIDMGRLMWLKECGLETQLVKYVPSTISPENHLLIAKCRNICAT